MPANPRPTDLITPDNLLIGMPYVEFAVLQSGVLQPFRSLGIIDSAELAKELDTLALESSQSGTRVTVRELITRIDPTVAVGIFNLNADSLQYVLGSSSKTAVTASATEAVSNEPHDLTTDTLDFIDLANSALNAGVSASPDAIDDEAVGTGDGLLGDVQGDFTLDYKVRAITDVTSVTTTNPTTGVVTVWTVIADGAAAAGNEVEVIVGLGSTSGSLQFFVAAVATAVPTGHTILADYEPSWGLSQPYSLLEDIQSAQADDGGVFTDETVDSNDVGAADVTLTPAVPVAGDAFYVGMSEPFDLVEFVISTAAVGSVNAYEYWNGSAWVALTGVSDETSNFTAAAGDRTLTFDVPPSWARNTVNAIGPYYHIRARVTTAGASGATASEVNVGGQAEMVVDRKLGKVRFRHETTKATSLNKLLAGQPVEVTYTYNRKAHTTIQPFTQTSFLGAARIRHLADVGINLVWDVPSAQILLDDTSFEWSAEEFTVGTLTLKILDAGGTARFGTIQVFSETQANV
jgi:hypothetical protein